MEQVLESDVEAAGACDAAVVGPEAVCDDGAATATAVAVDDTTTRDFGGEEALGAEITHTSGCTRLCNSIFMAICVAPLVILSCCFALGWNERRAVCDMKAISEGSEAVVEADCNSIDSHPELIMFSCDLQRTGLPTFYGEGDFAYDLQFLGVGLKTEAEMRQCVEHEHVETRKDSVGGGTTHYKTYSYERQWSSSHVDSSLFRDKNSRSFRDNCDGENPPWPIGAPKSNTQYADFGKVGPYTVPKFSFLERVPLATPLAANSTPSGWYTNGNAYRLDSGAFAGLGDVRVAFYGNDWSQTTMTVLGKNTNGQLSRWTASDSWLCSGFQLGEMRVGVREKEELFQAMQLESNSLTWGLRFLFLMIMWSGFCCIFKPLEVVADCVPFIGPFLGDSVSVIITCVTCPLACACGVGVAGAVWVVMRPLVGLVMMAIFLLCFCGAVVVKRYAQKHKDDERDTEVSAAPEVQEAVVVQPREAPMDGSAEQGNAVVAEAQTNGGHVDDDFDRECTAESVAV